MTLYDLIREKPGYKKQSANTWEGPCPKCGSQWRMIVWIHKDVFKCQSCDFKGDVIKWLRQVEGYSCREAFLEVGRDCETPSCTYYDKCKGNTTRRRRAPRSATCPERKQSDWQPRPAEAPEELWQQKAGELVDWAHERLLAAPDRLQYLASRGLPLEAVQRYRLGWNPGEERKGKHGPLFKQRSAWGLENKVNDDGKEVKVLAIQRGFIIPSFVDGAVYRIRIRRPDEDLAAYTGPDDKKSAKYLFLEGSGKGLVLRNTAARAYMVVESDFDDLLLDFVAGDLICSLALTSCSIRPDSDAFPVLSRADCLLNALDYDPRINQKGQYENPGGQAARWWNRHFPNSVRWPPPKGKDPGDAFKEGVDLRQWIADGLPIALQPRLGSIGKQKEVVPVEKYDADRAYQLVKDSMSRIRSSYRSDAWEWLAINMPKVTEFIGEKESTVNSFFESEDEAGLVRALEVIERAYEKAWSIYAERPPVINVEKNQTEEGANHVS